MAMQRKSNAVIEMYEKIIEELSQSRGRAVKLNLFSAQNEIGQFGPCCA